jgi:hypothetical protein
MAQPFSNRYVLGTLLVLWSVGLAAGAQALWRYSATPGPTGDVLTSWPVNAPIQPKPGHPMLVMLAHPHCPCTRASLAEFSRLVGRVDVDAWVLFLRPEGAQPGWEQTSLWKTAEAISGVRVLADQDGAAAEAFGAETSGHVLFCDANGKVQFSGGITSARGHEGTSAGSEAIRAELRGKTGLDHALTFGCPLRSQEAQP